jgi:protein-S-isoprenylcysteine O-methyltransferase Ste14
MMLTVRLTLILVGAAAYFGLAVLGWDGLAAFFSHSALIALAAVVFVLAFASLFAGGNLSPGVREDRGNRWVIVVFALIGLLDAYLPAYTDRKDFWTIDGDTIRWLGVVLFAAGGALRLWPVFVLGDRFSGLVAIQRGHTLVTNGVYGVIRHPSYLGLLVNSLVSRPRNSALNSARHRGRWQGAATQAMSRTSLRSGNAASGLEGRGIWCRISGTGH